MQCIAMKIYIAIDIHLYRVQPPYRSSPPEQRKGWWYGGGWLEGTKGLFVYYSFYLLIFLSFCLPSWAKEWLVVWWWWLEGTTGLHRVTEGSQTFATSSHNAQSTHFAHNVTIAQSAHFAERGTPLMCVLECITKHKMSLIKLFLVHICSLTGQV